MMNEVRVLSCVDRNLHIGVIELDRAFLIYKGLSADIACPVLIASLFLAGCIPCLDKHDIAVGGELGDSACLQRGLHGAGLVEIISLADDAVVILNIALLGAGGGRGGDLT